MIDAKDFFELGLKFHGHKCPAMPMGLRAGAAAMNALGTARSQDKELLLFAETGDDHAAGCFVDGLMTVTGCTYGKSNITKSFEGKMAFTLVDTMSGKAVRVQLKPMFFANMLNSPFVQRRKEGILPQNIPAEVTNPLVNGILDKPEVDFLDISPVFDYSVSKTKGIFDTDLCFSCGERVFVNKLVEKDNKKLCLKCSEK